MNEETITATPAVQATAEQVQQVEKTTPESTTEQTQEGKPDATDPEAPKKEPWFQKRIGELTREKYEARREAETHAHELTQLREQLARQGDPTQQPNQGDVQTLVQREAARLVAERSFNDACNKVYETGKAEFPNFDKAVSNLQLVGVGREFLELTATSDAGAKLINHLGTDLDEAARIASLPPLQMARELTRLEIKLGQTQAKPTSNAPAPLTLVNGTQGGAKSPSEMTDAEFAKWRKSQIAQRS